MDPVHVILGLIVGTCVGKLIEPDQNWVSEALRRHNEFRRGFASPPLRLNPKLCETSLQSARKLAHNERKLGASGLDYGENIFTISGKNFQVYGSTPVDAWYDQILKYDSQNEISGSGNDDSDFEFFIQLVWKETTDMCISYAASEPDKDGSATLFVVAHYLPKGNDYEDEPDNVTPLVASPYYYPDSESAPSRNHLSLPVGKTGELVGKVEDFIPEYSCWNDWDPLGNNEADVTTPKKFIQETLNFANGLRLHHQGYVLPILDQTNLLCKSAQAWANKFASANSSEDYPNPEESNCGALFYSSIGLLAGEDLVRIWYKEGQDYEFHHHQTSHGTSAANFVRLIWKETQQMCVAYEKKTGSEEYVYVGLLYQNWKANYDDIEARKKNVLSTAPGSFFSLSAIGLGMILSQLLVY